MLSIEQTYFKVSRWSVCLSNMLNGIIVGCCDSWLIHMPAKDKSAL
jgi:hypothetical protein